MQFPDDPNQQERIEKLRAELKKLGGYQIPLADMPADIEEEFLRHILSTKPLNRSLFLAHSKILASTFLCPLYLTTALSQTSWKK